jgi:hypothetical protein
MHWALPLLSATMFLSAPAGTFAQSPPAARDAEVVYTRGEFRGTFEEEGGRRLYARIKLAPGRKLPFSTLTFRVRDPKLVVGIAPGATVEFRAEPVDGENTITALRIPSP